MRKLSSLFFFSIFCIILNSQTVNVVSNREYENSTNVIQILRVNFDFDKYNLNEEFRNSIWSTIESNKNIEKIFIEGHTDEKGSDEYNFKLGSNRALSVYNEIISQSYPSSNIFLYSFGKKKPIYDNNTKDGTDSNRRVDVFIKYVEKAETPIIATTTAVKEKKEFAFNFWWLLILLLIILIIITLYYLINWVISGVSPKFLQDLYLTDNIGQFTICGSEYRKLIEKLYNLKKLKEMIDEFRTIVKRFVCEKIPETTQAKGHLGEMLTNNVFSKTKIYGSIYELIPRITNTLMKEPHHGIDHILKNSKGEYVIAESKFGTSQLGMTKDGKQMSMKWIKNRLKPYGITEEEYKKIMNAMRRGMVKFVKSHIDVNGNVTLSELSRNANIKKAILENIKPNVNLFHYLFRAFCSIIK